MKRKVKCVSLFHLMCYVVQLDSYHRFEPTPSSLLTLLSTVIKSMQTIQRLSKRIKDPLVHYSIPINIDYTHNDEYADQNWNLKQILINNKKT